MFRQIATNMARQAAPLRTKGKRLMSGSPEEALKSMEVMKKATAGGVCVVGVLCVVNVFIHMSHEHGHENPLANAPYMKIYNKPFPWFENKCNLFDLDCKEAFRKMKAAK